MNQRAEQEWFVLEETPPLDLFLYYPVLLGICQNEDASTLYGTSLKNGLALTDATNSVLCFKANEWHDVSHAYEKYFSDIKTLAGINTRIEQASIQLNSFANDVRNKVPASLPEAYQMYADFLSYISLLYAHAVYYELLELGPDHLFTEYLKQILSQKTRDEKRCNDLFTTLTTSLRPSWVMREKLDFLKLCQSIQTGSKGLGVQEERATLVRKHRDEYFWIPGFDGHTAWSEQDIATRVADYRGIPTQELEQLEHDTGALYATRADALQTLCLSEQEVSLFHISQEVSYLKDFRRGIQNKAFLVTSDVILQAIARYRPFSVQELRMLTLAELQGCSDEVLREKLEQRTQGWAYIILDGKEVGVEGGAGLQTYIDMVGVQSEPIGPVLTGSVAFRGQVATIRGVAKIITTRADIEKMQQGDILISHMTNPDIIEALGKAAAIVTDMGGITCHAAIVARELKIPCVIGTKYATRKFRDGDMVQVSTDDASIKLYKEHE